MLHISQKRKVTFTGKICKKKQRRIQGCATGVLSHLFFVLFQALAQSRLARDKVSRKFLLNKNYTNFINGIKRNFIVLN